MTKKRKIRISVLLMCIPVALTILHAVMSKHLAFAHIVGIATFGFFAFLLSFIMSETDDGDLIVDIARAFPPRPDVARGRSYRVTQFSPYARECEDQVNHPPPEHSAEIAQEGIRVLNIRSTQECFFPWEVFAKLSLSRVFGSGAIHVEVRHIPWITFSLPIEAWVEVVRYAPEALRSEEAPIHTWKQWIKEYVAHAHRYSRELATTDAERLARQLRLQRVAKYYKRPTKPSSVPLTRGTSPAGQEPRHGSRSAHG